MDRDRCRQLRSDGPTVGNGAVDRDGIWISVYPDVYKRGFDYRGAAKALLLGVSDRVDWKLVEKALATRDGILIDVTLKASPAPGPVISPEVPATP